MSDVECLSSVPDGPSVSPPIVLFSSWSQWNRFWPWWPRTKAGGGQEKKGDTRDFSPQITSLPSDAFYFITDFCHFFFFFNCYFFFSSIWYFQRFVFFNFFNFFGSKKQKYLSAFFSSGHKSFFFFTLPLTLLGCSPKGYTLKDKIKTTPLPYFFL